MTLDLTDAAIDDLRKIREYTLQNWGTHQEELYLTGIWHRFSEVLENPERFRLREDLFPGCRIAAYQSHIILFRVETNTLEVMRVLHGAMDVSRHLPKNLERE